MWLVKLITVWKKSFQLWYFSHILTVILVHTGWFCQSIFWNEKTCTHQSLQKGTVTTIWSKFKSIIQMSLKWIVTSPFVLYECVQYHHGNQCVVHIWLLPVRSSVCCAVESHKIVVVVTILNYLYTEFVYNVCYV